MTKLLKFVFLGQANDVMNPKKVSENKRHVKHVKFLF